MHPTAKEFRAAARNSLRGYWGWAILVCVVAWLLVEGLGTVVSAGLVSLILGGAVQLGACAYFSRLNLGHNPELSALFDRFDIFLKAMGLRLFMMLFIFLWSLLLFVPGIIAAYRYSLAPYLMAEYPEMGVQEAVDRSKELMAGNKGRLFCLELSFIGWWLLSMLTFGILALWIIPYVQTARAAFYLELTGKPFGQPNGR